MAALPIAMLGATVLGVGAAWASTFTAESEKDSIQLQSGQHVRVQGRVRLSEDGKKNHPDSCLVASEDGIVTKVDVAGRKATVRCSKNRRAAPEELSADDLEVIDSGINAPGISIPGGYLTEGATVRMLESSKRTNRGKALASPFYNPVGTVMVIDKVAKQVVVLSNHLNNKSTAQEYYNIDDLEFVSGPSEAVRKGVEAGLALKIGSTVELKDDATRQKYARGFIDRNLVGTNPNSNKLADPKWEKFGIVKSITLDPKDKAKKIVIVRCVSKDSKKEVLEQKYPFEDLKAIPAISVERAGIAVFGGMAEMDTKVKLRSERKSAVSSKSLGRSAFGDVGTVSDLEPNDPNNLKVFVTCNGINPEEQTGDWYQPEDLEIAEPEDTEGEAVFGGRVVVGSTVRVMQSARGKKCLGTPEFGDVGTVKGIDPSAPDNLKINVTCGRTDAKQSEWYDPRDLSLYFPVDESGSELEKAKVALAAAQKELSSWQLQPQTYRRSEQGRTDRKALEDKVVAAQAEVDRLSGVGLDKTKASEMRNDSEEKLDEAVKLKRELEDVRLKLSRESTCTKPDRSKKYYVVTEAAVLEWLENMFITPIDYKALGTEPLQYSNSHRVAFAELQTASRSLTAQTKDDKTYDAYAALNKAKLDLREELKNQRSDTESFANLDDKLLDVARKQKTFDDTPVSSYKTALQTIDEKLKKLQEITTQIESAAYSGDSPAEKLLKRVADLETKTKKEIHDNANDLQTKVTAYNGKFLAEQLARTKLDTDKYAYDQKVLAKKKPNPPTTITDDVIEEALRVVDASRVKYLNAQKETLKARKEQAILSAKTTCSEITLESVNDMKSKIQKIINGKCGVLKTIDDLLIQVDDLISKRRRAFTMSQAVLDPKFGDPKNATFDIPITSPEDRIAEINEAMGQIEGLTTFKEGAWNKLQHLIDLCGTYPGDTLLTNAKKIKEYPPLQLEKCPPNPGQEPPMPNIPVRFNAKPPAVVPSPVVQVTPPMTPPGSPPGTPEESEDEAPAPTLLRKLIPDPSFFEKQENLGCGRHALNNLFGGTYFIKDGPPVDIKNPKFPISLIQLCKYLESQGVRLSTDTGTYCPPDENYDEQVLVGALNIIGYRAEQVYDQNAINETVPSGEEMIGFIRNPGGGHWVSYRKTGTNYTFIDSIDKNSIKTVSLQDIKDLYNPSETGNIRSSIIKVIYTGQYRDPTEQMTVSPSGGKRKWPFYGRRTTRRKGGATYENPIRARINQRIEARNNPFYNAQPNTPPTTEEIVQQQLADRRPEQTPDITEQDADLPPPVPPPTSTFDIAENRRQFDEAIRATEEKTRLQLEQNQKEYQRQLAVNQRVQDEAIAELKKIAEKGALDERKKASRLELERKIAENEEAKKRLLQEVLDKNNRVRSQALFPLQHKVETFKDNYNNEVWKKKMDELFKKLEKSIRETAEENKREAEKQAAKLRKEQEADEARLARVKKEREAFLKTKSKKDLESELLTQGGPELLAAWKKEQKDKAVAQAAADKLYDKNTKDYNSLTAKWDEYYAKHKVWESFNEKFVLCEARNADIKNKWQSEYETWLAVLKKSAKDLSTDQILRLQSRGVGSSLMLDESRKLMIDADAQQRTVMDGKTDLQFTLASSSDADIAKAVGFYEAEAQKLKTCISKGKDDAIAEYEKDLAEIEKRKKEITAKTFEVKAPQENAQQLQGTPKYNEWDTARLTSEVGRLDQLLKQQQTAPVGSKQHKKQAGTNIQLTAARKALQVKLVLPASAPAPPQPGGRRMTMRRRRT